MDRFASEILGISLFKLQGPWRWFLPTTVVKREKFYTASKENEESKGILFCFFQFLKLPRISSSIFCFRLVSSFFLQENVFLIFTARCFPVTFSWFICRSRGSLIPVFTVKFASYLLLPVMQERSNREVLGFEILIMYLICVSNLLSSAPHQAVSACAWR